MTTYYNEKALALFIDKWYSTYHQEEDIYNYFQKLVNHNSLSSFPENVEAFFNYVPKLLDRSNLLVEFYGLPYWSFNIYFTSKQNVEKFISMGEKTGFVEYFEEDGPNFEIIEEDGRIKLEIYASCTPNEFLFSKEGNIYNSIVEISNEVKEPLYFEIGFNGISYPFEVKGEAKGGELRDVEASFPIGETSKEFGFESVLFDLTLFFYVFKSENEYSKINFKTWFE